MKNYCFLIVFIIGLLTVPAKTDMTGMKFNESMSDWKLYSRDPKNGLEFFYDTKNMMYPTKNSVIVTVKTVYNSKNAINELKRIRKQNSLIKKDLNYDNLAYSIKTLEMYCIKKETAASEIMFDLDFDSKGNIVNLVPNIPDPLPIPPNSYDEALYKILCSHKNRPE